MNTLFNIIQLCMTAKNIFSVQDYQTATYSTRCKSSDYHCTPPFTREKDMTQTATPYTRWWPEWDHQATALSTRGQGRTIKLHHPLPEDSVRLSTYNTLYQRARQDYQAKAFSIRGHSQTIKLQHPQSESKVGLSSCNTLLKRARQDYQAMPSTLHQRAKSDYQATPCSTRGQGRTIKLQHSPPEGKV